MDKYCADPFICIRLLLLHWTSAHIWTKCSEETRPIAEYFSLASHSIKPNMQYIDKAKKLALLLNQAGPVRQGYR